MKYLQPAIMIPLLASMFLMHSFTAFASQEVKSNQTTKNSCLIAPGSTKLCSSYAKGYLDALQQLNQVGKNTGFSSFEERAFKTRLGISSQTNPLQEKFGICLPSKISDSEVNNLLASSNKELPVEGALLKIIQAKYPC